jgi:hypothetical protein
MNAQAFSRSLIGLRHDATRTLGAQKPPACQAELKSGLSFSKEVGSRGGKAMQVKKCRFCKIVFSRAPFYAPIRPASVNRMTK